jgi:hypothetical protein
MYFVFMYENRTMKPLKFLYEGEKVDEGERWRG